MTNHTMTCDDAQGLLPDLLDGTLRDEHRAPFEAHLAACPQCASLAGDLAKIRDDAAALPTLTPSRDLWGGIAERLDAPVLAFDDGARARRGAVGRWTTRQVAAAAAALITVSAGGTWMVATRATTVAPLVATSSSMPVEDGTRAALVSVADRKGIDTYESEIAKLRNILTERRTELDSTTVAVLERNLSVIDRAITESKAALAADPASAFLASRLNHAYDTKLELLRSAATLPSRS